jgi:hypothetical protein
MIFLFILAIPATPTECAQLSQELRTALFTIRLTGANGSAGILTSFVINHSSYEAHWIEQLSGHPPACNQVL